MLPLSSHIKDAFDKFEHTTAKWYKVRQPCYEDKIQELNKDFSKICISPKPSGVPMGKIPLPVLKELEHQARQNLSTINLMISSSCNSTLEKCQHSLKSSFYCVNTTYLVDRCICPAPCRSRQTLEKNVLSWALAGTGNVLFTRQVAVQPTCRYTAHALSLFLFGA